MREEVRRVGHGPHPKGFGAVLTALRRNASTAAATVAGFAAARTFGALEAGLLALWVGALFCAHALWQHHVKGGRHRRIELVWVAAVHMAASIPFLLFVHTHPPFLGFVR